MNQTNALIFILTTLNDQNNQIRELQKQIASHDQGLWLLSGCVFLFFFLLGLCFLKLGKKNSPSGLPDSPAGLS